MVWKAEMELRKIFQHGNSGFSLIESVVSIFIASLFLCGITVLVLSTLKNTLKIKNEVTTIISTYNSEAEKMAKK